MKMSRKIPKSVITPTVFRMRQGRALYNFIRENPDKEILIDHDEVFPWDDFVITDHLDKGLAIRGFNTHGEESMRRLEDGLCVDFGGRVQDKYTKVFWMSILSNHPILRRPKVDSLIDNIIVKRPWWLVRPWAKPLGLMLDQFSSRLFVLNSFEGDHGFIDVAATQRAWWHHPVAHMQLLRGRSEFNKYGLVDLWEKLFNSHIDRHHDFDEVAKSILNLDGHDEARTIVTQKYMKEAGS